jgi:hypothetical protein
MQQNPFGSLGLKARVLKPLIKLAEGIHELKPVSEEPQIVLSKWKVYEVQWSDGFRSRHFVGNDDLEGKVSAEIVDFSFVNMYGRDKSGKIYILEASPAFDVDAEYVWRFWLKAIGNPKNVDISEEYY